MIRKIAIYDPYLDTLGGGERYCLTIAEILLSQGCQVDLFWSKDKTIVSKAASRFSLNLDNLNIVPDIFKIADNPITYEVPPKVVVSSPSRPSLVTKINNLVKRWKITSGYDLIIFLSDGSIPILFAKKNYLHIQVPFKKNFSFFDRLKLQRFTGCIFNSKFTKSFYPTSSNSSVLYPPVDVDQFDPLQKKENIILSVGRFDNILNAKRQDALITAFKQFNQQQKGWQLILAGGSVAPEAQNSFIRHLKRISDKSPVSIVVNPSFGELKNLYQKSSIYWHAAGYEVDPIKHPEATEHFGITVVEAMAAGLVPVVINRGGLPEIITDNLNGLLWHNIEQLIAKTKLLITSPQVYNRLSGQAITSAQNFSKANFKTNFKKIINYD